VGLRADPLRVAAVEILAVMTDEQVIKLLAYARILMTPAAPVAPPMAPPPVELEVVEEPA
jgi:hypothetical protein